MVLHLCHILAKSQLLMPQIWGEIGWEIKLLFPIRFAVKSLIRIVLKVFCDDGQDCGLNIFHELILLWKIQVELNFCTNTWYNNVVSFSISCELLKTGLLILDLHLAGSLIFSSIQLNLKSSWSISVPFLYTTIIPIWWPVRLRPPNLWSQSYIFLLYFM